MPYLPRNTIAEGYDGLQVVSVFDPLGYAACRWRFNDQATNQAIEIFSIPVLLCTDRESDINFRLNCVETNGVVNTTLTILAPLQINAAITIECGKDIISVVDIQARIDLHVTGKCNILQTYR